MERQKVREPASMVHGSHQEVPDPIAMSAQRKSKNASAALPHPTVEKSLHSGEVVVESCSRA